MASGPRTGKSAVLAVNVFDGTRQPLRKKADILFTVFNGYKKQLYRRHRRSPNLTLRVPYEGNASDNHTVIVWAKGYGQAGFFPVRTDPSVPESVDLMLLPANGSYDFREARWDRLTATHPSWTRLLARGVQNDSASRDRYTQLMEARPDALAALLNILCALDQINLPAGGPLEYFEELVWDETMERDRFFAYAQPELLVQVRRAEKHGLFARESGAGVFHPGATDSYKQVQFGEANVQLTFHENDKKAIGGAESIKVECDVDYYRDLAAHAMLEVFVNAVSGSLTNPRQVYALRWMAGRQAGVPDFNPPYTIV